MINGKSVRVSRIPAPNLWRVNIRKTPKHAPQSQHLSNRRTIVNGQLEGRAPTALRERMLQPNAIEAYAEGYRQTMATRREQRLRTRATLEKREAEAKPEDQAADVGNR